MKRIHKIFGSIPGVNIFYGWWIVLSCVIILSASVGIGFYCHGVILDPIRNRFGWSNGIVSSAVTLFFSMSGIVGLIIGPKIDRLGAKPFIVSGALIFSASFCLLCYIDRIWQLLLVYFLMSIGFCFSSLLPVSTLITNWFVRKRGLAFSFTTIGLSLGAVFLVPLASYLVINNGFKTMVFALSAIYSIMIVPITLLVVKTRPADLNLQPDGVAGDVSDFSVPQSSLNNSVQQFQWTRVQVFKTKAFWAIAIAFSVGLCCQNGFLVHQVPFFSGYLGKMGAATLVSITTGASVLGRLILGGFVDRYEKRYLAACFFTIQGIALLLLALSQHTVILYFSSFMFGLMMGPVFMMMNLITGDCFGMVSFGMISGLIGLFQNVGSSLGPVIAGVLFDVTGGYVNGFFLFALFYMISMISIFFARIPDLPLTDRKPD